MLEKNECKDCKAARLVKGPDGKLDFRQRECHLNPPQVSILTVPQLGPQGQVLAVELKILTAWPTVRKDEDCLHWSPVEGLAEHGVPQGEG
jgi:hypothetical protein